jgi:hypothetical protein
MFGQPSELSNPSTGRLQFQPGSSADIGVLVVQLDIFDGQSVRDRAFSITAQHPSDHVWSMSEARGVCEAFRPADARFQAEVKVPGSGGQDGVDDIYISQSLANTFPASTFVDGAQNRVAPGTFDLRFLFASPGDTSQVQSCTLELGKQQSPVAVSGNG